jgi:hypothetical protein
MSMIDRLNALAKRVRREAFNAAGALDCVTYVVVHVGVGVIYVGEGLLNRATMQFEKRGKNSPELDDYIGAHWPNFEIYIAASNITKAVAVEFEGVLIREFKPRFNERPPASIWASCAVGPDTFVSMCSAARIDYKFVKPPRLTHVAAWKRCAKKVGGQKVWDEIHGDWIITRVSLRPKFSRPDKKHEIIHYNSYPALGESVTVADHRARNEAWMSWETIKAILHWDRLYLDALGPIITIGPPG